MLEWISQPWHWSVSGAAIAAVMFLLLYAGKEFGVSSNLRTMCTIAGAGRKYDFFRIDWRAQRWNLTFVAGSVLGGFLAFYVLPSSEPVTVSAETVTYLQSVGLSAPGAGELHSSFVPGELFAVDQLFTLRTLLVVILGGFLVGFGARWAGGCTSGHAISGLSNLQLPSLIAVVGFFIGGLFMSWVLLPFILQL
ncbi:YeeE/YedE family protein [Neolewinella litorea]|uniref:YeeE/YedE family protein n=1 Tax=Neolewinella litorea TaxID=2562452 RepID=A0A4S4NKX0_9BACT|nr:YeeE/YedE thiosulfate transporter family protein [Neolewinella litorea]THH40544.1 YeeE/YedE family protein [Neolewinella litorea]